jgi:hypothetical protein
MHVDAVASADAPAAETERREQAFEITERDHPLPSSTCFKTLLMRAM